ncbi:SPOR domain-containing protein [Tranquillimonas alkanivorans]|uniref:Sporulation related domain-containing protein n=1 Tax=Tranquillimonas alkanivorans TaxID=441119 RepID=A0A1I5S945_9RHOB|nr:SPOR domain-containing protein [Tranquillimonas alkanivorans]SFP67328.1 Sporulation related domain-containing protein [Tranquillimonas alkanivorans]
MAKRNTVRLAILLGGAMMLSACEEGPGFLPRPGSGATGADAPAERLVERDVEAPEIFQVTEAGLWDGRPSLGGVWVAHPDVTDPERVIIRNETNGNFVIGALFRRERETPGPRLQVSSDAAEALGMLAGEPVRLDVTALRREEAAESGAPTEPVLSAPETIDSRPLESDPALADAAAAIDRAEAADTAPPAPPPASEEELSRPYIQIGIFSVEQNADNAAASLRRIGVVPTVRQQTSSGKTFWRVIAGPAPSADERADLLEKVKDLGYSDAFYVAN